MSKLFGQNANRKEILIFLTVFGLGLIPSQSYHRHMLYIDDTDKGHNLILNNYDTAYTINTTGCSVPKLKQEDQSIKTFIHYPLDIESCPTNHHPLLLSNQTHIWVATKYLKYYNITFRSEFKCCYRSFHQITARLVHNLLHEVVYLDCIPFNKVIQASNEFVEVECYYYDDIIHKQFFIFVPKKKFPERQGFELEKATFNVIIMGLRSVSRINAHRSMPRTLNLLKKLGAIELFGYHAVGDGTLDNILPILTGMTTYELNATCLSSNANFMYDSCPFIWEMFKNVGYITALLQDTAQSGIFDSDMYGLSGKPADYFVHPFIKQSEINEKLARKRKKNTKYLHFWSKPEKKKKDFPEICMGNKFYFNLILEYVERLTEILQTSKLFGFFWESSLSRSVNAPIVMDEKYENFIRKLNKTGYLDKTILILLSDEGISRGGIQTTKQGRLEKRLPLATILVPQAFRDRYKNAYESLKINKNRLTTPFDLHETLIDLIEMNGMVNSEMITKNRSKLMYERGMSLFVPIQSNRTCESAGIYNFWCTCHQRRGINVHSKLVQKAVKYIKAHLNWLLRFHHQCAKLDIETVIEAEELWPSYRKETEWREYRFEIRVTPGAAEYEALLRRDKRDWSLLAPIRRLDVYNEPGDCFTDSSIKWLCYCRHDAINNTSIST